MEKQRRTRDVKLIPIGNSQGIRLPRAILQKYGFSDTLVLEETGQGILLRRKEDNQLSWEETYRAMAQEQEDWSDFDTTVADGLEGDDPSSEEV
jgi:antitoxin MazE